MHLRTYYIPLAKPTRSPRTDYMPLQNLNEHTKTNYMPCNTCVPYYYLIIFRSSHRHTEHKPDTHNTTLTSTTMGGLACHHVKKALSTYIHWHGRTHLLPSRKGSCVSLPLGGNLDLKNSKLLSEVLKLPSSHFYCRITSGLITSKDNLQASLGLITSEENL